MDIKKDAKKALIQGISGFERGLSHRKFIKNVALW